jgi:predicted TIM-barrel fold metal-dependent hydrolase
MSFRAFDIHAHFRTGERRVVDAKLGDATKLFGSNLRDVDPVEFYADRGMMAVVFDVDAETNSGQQMSNDEIAALVGRSDGRLIGFASVDPWKGKAAIRELERSKALGLRGLKVQPITQAFDLNDPRFYPLWDACKALSLPVIVHTGTTGIGAGSPGGRGLRLKYGRPVPALDDVAADFPDVTWIAAHFAWPWHLELMAVARHKGNVFVDLSGWAPRYIPAEVLQYANSVIPEKFLFGSDFPLLSPDRWLSEFDALAIKDEVRPKILYENACRVLDVDPALFSTTSHPER